MQRSSKKRRSPSKRKFRMGAGQPEQLTLHIRTSSRGPVFTVNLPLHSTVKDLKEHIYETKNIKIDRQKFIIQKQMLKDDRPLLDFNGGVFYLYISDSIRPIRLILQNLAGRQYIIENVTGSSSIKFLKERLAFDITTDELQKLDHRPSRDEFLDRVVTPGRITLFLLDRNLVLIDTNEIDFYNLKDDDVIHISIDPRSQQEDWWATFTYKDNPESSNPISYYAAYGMRPRRKKSLRKTKKSSRKTKKSSRK